MLLSKLFQIFNADSVDDNENYIVLDDFFNFLKKQDSGVKRSNVNRSFRTYKGGIKTVNNKQVVSVISILKFTFSHLDTFRSCASLARNIEQCVLGDKKSEEINTVNTSLDIYKLIAKTKFPNLDLLFEKVTIVEAEITTLVSEHKSEFTYEEWSKICWFEKHFSRTLDRFDIDYDEIIRLKFRQYQSLTSVQQCKENWSNISRQQIKLKTLRIETAESLNESEIDAPQKHIPAVIERYLWSVVQEDKIDELEGIAVFDSRDSIKKNIVHGVLELKNSHLINDKEEICQMLFYSLNRKHQVQLEKVFFFHAGSLSEFKSGDRIHRFHLRDCVLNGSILDNCIDSWNANDELISSEVTDDDNSKCPSCFDPGLPQPLSSKGFQILEEWFLETPLETQILFDCFINRESLRRSPQPEDFMHQKFEKLYFVYDILLNVYNKNFIGVLQQSNTQELLTEYKSIGLVFDVTSSAGATTSLKDAERKLKKRSDQDLCYFNTYLKRHKLIYDTVVGDNEKEVSLRECHLILLLDNLVKWTNKKVTTTKRSETMTNLMCTLPITLQGLPEDSAITDKWHTEACDGSANCVCKQSVPLTKADIDDVLINLSEDEQNAYQQFGNLMAWGYNQLWAKMTDEVLVHVELGQTGSSMGTGEAPAADLESSSEEALETVESIESFEEELDLIQILTSVTDTVPKDDDDTLFRNNEEPSDVNEQFDVNSTNNIQYSDDDVSHVSQQDILNTLEDDEPCSENSSQHSNMSDCEDEEMETVDRSFHNLSLHESPEMSAQTLLSTFGFEKFVVPPLLSRHPPPATGRDDDVMKIKEIMDDTITKMGYENDENTMSNRILSGPDHKIGKCMFSLINGDKKYERFLLEFPLLHLRKSKITILFSAYSEAGLVQLLQYMRDNDQTNWESLMSAQHIDTATRYVKRVSLSLHLAFMVVFTRYLDNRNLENYIYDLETLEPKEISERWNQKFEDFLEKGSKDNATFALHRDMMTHCDEVIAIALAERLGGPDGHALLRAAVKSSLPFVFLNGASSYAPYCVKLLYHHHSAGPFYKNLKQTLYSTPFKTSKKNFACDTKRELDHLDAIKGFRSGSTVASATVRMSLIDSLN